MYDTIARNNDRLLIDGGGYTVKFHQLFKAAIHEPKKLAAFRLLPIGKVFTICIHFRCVIHMLFHLSVI